MGRHSAPIGPSEQPAEDEHGDPTRPRAAHRAAAGSRPRGRAVWFVLVAVLVVASVVTAISVWPSHHTTAAHPSSTPGGTGPSCPAGATSGTPISIAATPVIAGVIGTVAQEQCIPVLLRSLDGDAGGTLLAQHDADVWVPDSIERGDQLSRLATDDGSTATSPLLLVGAPGRAAMSLSWRNLVPSTPGGPSPTLQVVQPTVSSAALAVAGPMSTASAAALHNTDLGYGTTATALSRVVQVGPDSTDPVPTEAYRFLEARAVTAKVGTPVLLSDGAAQLDFPWFTARTAAADPTLAPLIEALRSAVQGSAADAARHAAGLLSPGAKATALPDGRSQSILAPATAASVPMHYGMADPGSDRGNTTVVVDVSGSMFDPGPSGQSVIDAVRASALSTLGLFFGSSRLGLWYFAYKLDGQQDYRVTVPLGPVAQTRPQISTALAGLRTPAAGTALYSTVLAAYRAQQAQYVAGAVNAVAIFTDGRDEDDPHRIDLTELLAQLRAVADPSKPIPVLMFAFGSADLASMQQIVGVTGGGVYPISNPAQVAGAVVRAAGAAVQRSWG